MIARRLSSLDSEKGFIKSLHVSRQLTRSLVWYTDVTYPSRNITKSLQQPIAGRGPLLRKEVWAYYIKLVRLV